MFSIIKFLRYVWRELTELIEEVEKTSTQALEEQRVRHKTARVEQEIRHMKQREKVVSDYNKERGTCFTTFEEIEIHSEECLARVQVEYNKTSRLLDNAFKD